jgi:transcription initiation factor IIE alpha subunit
MIDIQETDSRDELHFCPACATELELTHQFLDPKQGKTVRLFKCEKCGERVWEE